MSVPGGPGWLNDIFDARLAFEEGSYTLVPDEDLNGKKVKSFDGLRCMSGKLIIAPPEGRDVSHRGVLIILKSVASTHSGLQTEVLRKEWTLMEEGSLAEAIEVGFDIELAEVANLRDTFKGDSMHLRHFIGYRIVRPWYTFSVKDEEEILVHGCQPASTQAPPADHIISIEDCGGVCTLDHGKCEFSTDGRLVGSVNFSQMTADAAIASVELLLGRTEMWQETEGADSVVRHHLLHTPEMGIISTEYTIPIDIALSEKGNGTLGNDGPIPPTMVPLTPDDPNTDASHVVSVVYWLRLLLKGRPEPDKKEPKMYWATHPIKLLPPEDVGSI